MSVWRRCLTRGAFHSIADLHAATNRYLEEHNDDPKPFVWVKSANQTLKKLDRMSEPAV